MGSMTGPSSGPCAAPGQWSPGLACWAEGNEPLAPGPFPGPLVCSCQDSLNQTYSCMRTMAELKNTMYCEFDDDEHFVEYFDLSTDPWQLKNKATALSAAERQMFHTSLAKLKACKGKACSSELIQEPIVSV